MPFKTINVSNIIEEEKWYKVKYIKCDFPELKSSNFKENLILPHANQFMCNDIKIIPGINNNESPKLLHLNGMDLWWKYDTSYNTPNIYLSFNMILQNTNSTLKNKIMTNLYFKCLHHIINSDLYSINHANYEASVNQTRNGFNVSINGYSEKFIDVLTFLLGSLVTVKQNINVNIFDNIKKIYQTALENNMYNPPYQICSQELTNNIVINSYSVKETLEGLSKVKYEDLMTFNLFDTSRIVESLATSKRRLITGNSALYGLIQGNITYDNAMEIGTLVSQLNISYNNYELCDQLKEHSVNEFIQQVDNQNEANSCHRLAVKIGYGRPDLEPNCLEIGCLVRIIHEIISEQYFDQLRTKEQLGYVARSTVSAYGDSEQSFITYDFIVQSPHKDTLYLKERTMRFIKEFRDFLQAETDQSINNVIQAQILQLDKPFQNLDGAVAYNFSVIASYCGNFNLRNEKKEYMKTVTKQKLLDFYDHYFSLNEGSYWSMNLEGNKVPVMDSTVINIEKME